MVDVNMNAKISLHEKEVKNAMDEAKLKALLRCGQLVEAEAKKGMKSGGKIPGRKTGIPSAPGSPPNVQTGNLRASITTAATKEKTVVVGPTRSAWYGAIHEDGGEFGGRNFPARPFMKPALERAKQNFPKEFKDLPIASTSAGKSLNARKD